MKVIDSLNQFTDKDKFVVVALGNFDGVHIGHQALFTTMKDIAVLNNGVSVAFTFNPHPMEVLTGTSPKKLNTEIEKQSLIKKMGVNYLLNFPFSKEAADQSPEDFVEEFLIKGLNAKQVVVGFNYSFGKGGKGNSLLLQQICAKYGCTVTILDPVVNNAGVVSSTLIRNLLKAGKIRSANQLLGYEFLLSGVVVRGLQLGRKLGFPTANIRVDANAQLPAFGVYAAWTEVEGKRLKAVLNVGLRPTIDKNIVPTVEVNCLDFDGDLYDKEMSVRFVSEIRLEKKFDNLDSLKEQIGKDANKARWILDNE